MHFRIKGVRFLLFERERERETEQRNIVETTKFRRSSKNDDLVRVKWKETRDQNIKRRTSAVLRIRPNKSICNGGSY